MKIFTKIALYICLGWMTFISALIFTKQKAFAMEMTMSDELIDVIWTLFCLNSERTAGESGFTLDTLDSAFKEYIGQDNLEMTFEYNPNYAITYDNAFNTGIFDGTSEPQYLPESAQKNIFKAFLPQYIYEQGIIKAYQDIKNNVSESFNAETRELISQAVIEQYGYTNIDEALLNTYIVSFELGKQKFVYLIDSAGNWLSNSITDVLTSIGDLTFGDVQTYKDTAFLRDDFVETVDPLYTKSFSCRSSSNAENYDSYTVALNYPVFVYGSSPTGFQTTSGLIETQYYPLLTGQAQDIIYRNGVLADVYTATLDKSSHGTTSINGKSYTYFSLYFTNIINIDGNSIGGSFTPSVFKATFQTFSTLKTWLQENTDIPGYATPLVDTQGVPYTVPSTHGLASTIDHVYPAISATRDGVITVPKDDSITKPLVDTIPADIADVIWDAITTAITESIALPDVITDTADPEYPNPDPDNPDPLPEFPPELPSWFWPTMFPDILDFHGLEIFQPIFDIVGTNYSMYEIWIMIPAIIIFVVILYFIISVL